MVPADLGSMNTHVRTLKKGAMVWMLRRGQDGDTNRHFLCISKATAQPRYALHKLHSSSGATAVFQCMCVSIHQEIEYIEAMTYIFPRAI